MKTLVLLFIIFISLAFNAFGQKVSFTYKAPQHFRILDTVSGDLNGDRYRDYIVVLKSDDEKMGGPDLPRPLIILFGSKGNKLTQVARNDRAVLCYNCGGVFGDPYQGITIKNNYFSIDHYGGSSWRWTRHITFKFMKTRNVFILHKDGGESFHASEQNKSESYFRKKENFGKLPFIKYSNEEFPE